MLFLYKKKKSIGKNSKNCHFASQKKSVSILEFKKIKNV